MDEEFKINKMPTIKNKKDVEQLFEPGNFLYNIMNDCKNLIRELKKSEDYKNKDFNNSNAIINEIAKLEWAYIPHEDVSIHNWERAKEWYKECGLHIFKPTKGYPNDILTSNIYETKNYRAKNNVNFQAVMHSIGNMITAKENWLGGQADFIYHKLEYIMFPNNPNDKSDNHEKIKNAYLNHYNNKDKLLRELYLVDAWDYENICPKKSLDKYEPGTIDANTKFIIQRGYRMQLKYKNPKFSTKQKKELQTIFDYFEFEDTNVI